MPQRRHAHELLLETALIAGLLHCREPVVSRMAGLKGLWLAAVCASHQRFLACGLQEGRIPRVGDNAAVPALAAAQAPALKPVRGAPKAAMA